MTFSIPLNSRTTNPMINYLEKLGYTAKFTLEKDMLSGVLDVDKALDKETFSIVSAAQHVTYLIQLDEKKIK